MDPLSHLLNTHRRVPLEIEHLLASYLSPDDYAAWKWGFACVVSPTHAFAQGIWRCSQGHRYVARRVHARMCPHCDSL